MSHFHFSFFGLLLYSVSTLLLSPFQQELLTSQQWQLQSIKSKQQNAEKIAPGFLSLESPLLTLRPNGHYSTSSSSGTWQLRGKILHLYQDSASFSFRIGYLSKEGLLLQTKLSGDCVSLSFQALE